MKKYDFIVVDKFANRSILSVDAHTTKHAINKAKIICSRYGCVLIY